MIYKILFHIFLSTFIYTAITASQYKNPKVPKDIPATISVSSSVSNNNGLCFIAQILPSFSVVMIEDGKSTLFFKIDEQNAAQLKNELQKRYDLMFDVVKQQLSSHRSTKQYVGIDIKTNNTNSYIHAVVFLKQLELILEKKELLYPSNKKSLDDIPYLIPPTKKKDVSKPLTIQAFFLLILCYAGIIGAIGIGMSMQKKSFSWWW